MLPKDIKLAGRRVRIREKELRNLSGQWDPERWEILLHTDQTECERGVVLIHEVLHCLEDTFKVQGKLKRGISHAFIEDAARNLYWLLMQLGYVPKKPYKQFRKETRILWSLWPKRRAA